MRPELIAKIKSEAIPQAIPWLLKLEEMNACEPALDWCIEGQFETLESAWEACEDATYLAWLVPRCPGFEAVKNNFSRAILEIARTVEHLSPAAKHCNDVNEAYLDGKATLEELKNAAANATAYAAEAAYYPASAAKANAAYYAAEAAYYPAYATYYATEAGTPLSVSAEIIRKHVACPTLPKGE